MAEDKALNPIDALSKSMGLIIGPLQEHAANKSMTNPQIEMEVASDAECCDHPDVEDDGEDYDMEIHVCVRDEVPEEELKIIKVIYLDGMMELTINDSPVAIPWRMRVVLIG